MYKNIIVVRKLDGRHLEDVHDTAGLIRQYSTGRCVAVYDSYTDAEEIKDIDDVLIVAVGGDGTMLHAATLSLNYQRSAIVGLNYGHLGFLTEDVYPKHPRVKTEHIVTKFLDDIFENNTNAVKQDTRMALEAYTEFVGSEWPRIKFNAINEVTVGTSLSNFMRTTVAVDNMPLGKYEGNGVTVTTSTGSTALGLSAGGAIVSPSTNIIQIVPLLSHSIAKQPVIVSGRDTVKIRTEITERIDTIEVLADSQFMTHMLYNEEGFNYLDVTIKRANRDVTIWRPADWNFFDVLSQKMDWK